MMSGKHEGQLTIPELLEARDRVQSQLDALSYRGYAGTLGGDPKSSVRAELQTILQEIETELAELGYKDTDGS